MLGDRIKSARTECGLTQQELADQCGVIRQTITEYEAGRIEPSIRSIKKISEATKVPMSYFFDN